MTKENKIMEMFVHLFSGAAGGGFATLCSYPFSNLRVRMVSE